MERTKKSAVWQIMKFFGDKKVYRSIESAQKELQKREKQNKKKYRLPLKFRHFFQKLEFNNQPFGKFEYFKKSGSDTAILFLHGGAFSARPTALHWRFVQDLYARTGATVFVPLYPLAPKNSHKQTYIALLNFYKLLSRQHKKIFLLGDSAGGTLALGLVQLLAKEGLPNPKGIVALSPLVDISFSNPEMKRFDDVDTMLSREGAKYICQKWARGAGVKNPLVSPKFANFENFPAIYLFYGDYEIFCPDLREFTEIVQKNGGKIFAIEQKKSFHVYPLLPTPKAFDTREIIAKIITSKQLVCKSKKETNK